MKYIKWLDEQYQDAIESDCIKPKDKLEFLGEHIFNFTTYDGNLSSELALNMIAVLSAIKNKKTHEFIEMSDAHYRIYIVMCNMEFLRGRLEWGGSIRGAWFDYGSRGKFYDVNSEKIPSEDFRELCGDILIWVQQ